MEVFNSVLFAVNREDHFVENQVIKKVNPKRMLMIGSGGCIALSLKVLFPSLDLNVIDVNPNQISHINKKIKALKSSNLEELNVNKKNDYCLNQIGKFDKMFQNLRDLFIRYISEENEITRFFNIDTNSKSRLNILKKWLNNENISIPFQKVFNDNNINKIFSDAATKHGAPDSYINYMQKKIINGLKKKNAHINPFLQHIFLGFYKSPNAFPYINAKNIHVPNLQQGSILSVRDIPSYEIVSLSNIFDWSSEKLVTEHAEHLSQLHKGSAIIIRQINNHKNWIEIFDPYFEEDDFFDKYWQENDRSMFYDHIKLFIRK